MSSRRPVDPYLPDHGTSDYRVGHYDLTLDYKVGPNRLVGRAVLACTAARALPRFALDLHGLRVARVSVDGRAARYRQQGDKLHVQPARAIAPGAAFTVEVRYQGSPSPVATHWGDIGWDLLEDGVIVASQPVGAHTWFPCNDHPSDKAGYRLSVTVPSVYQVVANGSLVAQSAAASTRTWIYELPEPTPAYLVSVQIGRYALTETDTGDIPLTGAAPPGLLAESEADFDRQPEMLRHFQRMFGPYPFHRYTTVVVDEELDAPVEAQAMSIFGTNHVDGRRGHENLVAHELAHQWFGNSLTVACWQHIWLNEGFAQYAEWLWSEVGGGERADAHARRAWASLSRQPQDLRLADPGAPLIFDDRVYVRGALTLHTLRLTMGDAVFFDLVREWTATHRHGTVTTEAFAALAERHGGEPVTGLLAGWLYDLPLPKLPPR